MLGRPPERVKSFDIRPHIRDGGSDQTKEVLSANMEGGSSNEEAFSEGPEIVRKKLETSVNEFEGKTRSTKRVRGGSFEW